MKSPTEVKNRLQEILNEVSARQSRLQRVMADLKKQNTAFDPFETRSWLKTNAPTLLSDVPDIEVFAQQVDEVCNDLVMRFDSDFREAAAVEAWDVSGQWPRYYVAHLLSVAIDEPKRISYIGDQKLSTLFVSHIMASLRVQLGSVKPERERLPVFLQELQAAYFTLVSQEQRKTISVWDVYREMFFKRQSRKFWCDATSGNFHPFPQLEFKAYLTELLKLDMTSIGNSHLRLHPPVSKDDSLYLFQPAENRFCHVGRIEFVVEGGVDDRRIE